MNLVVLRSLLQYINYSSNVYITNVLTYTWYFRVYTVRLRELIRWNFSLFL